MASRHRRRNASGSGSPSCVLVCISSAVPTAREYRTVEVESLRVTIDSDWVPRAAPGYLPVRFDITNLGDARVIEIVALGSRMFRAVPRSSTTAARPSGQGSSTVSQTLRLARGDRVRFTMSIPIFGDNENFRFELREGNRMIERFNYVGFQSRTPVADASVLFVADSSEPVRIDRAETGAEHRRPRRRHRRRHPCTRRRARALRPLRFSRRLLPAGSRRWTICSSRPACRSAGPGSHPSARWRSARREWDRAERLAEECAGDVGGLRWRFDPGGWSGGRPGSVDARRVRRRSPIALSAATSSAVCTR